MSEKSQEGEPSIEEILASIRKIINEDEEGGESSDEGDKPEEPSGGVEEEDPEADILDLTEVFDASQAKKQESDEPVMEPGVFGLDDDLPADEETQQAEIDELSKIETGATEGDSEEEDLDVPLTVQPESDDAEEVLEPTALDALFGEVPKAKKKSYADVAAGADSGSGPDVEEPLAADEIDALFGSPAETAPKADAPAEEPASAQPENLEEPQEPLTPPVPEPAPIFEDEPAEEAVITEPEREPEPEPVFSAPPEQKPVMSPMQAAVSQELIGEIAAVAASGAMAKLARVTPPGKDNIGKLVVGTNTLEDIVREMLRPMLKEWLDTNLPPIVERLVERELEKLGRQAEDWSSGDDVG